MILLYIQKSGNGMSTPNWYVLGRVSVSDKGPAATVARRASAAQSRVPV
jgi:hypothetical protein